MDRFTLEQRWGILKNYFQSECCVAETVRKLRTIFGRNEAPSAPGVRKLLRKVRETGMLKNNRSHPRARPVRTAERIAAVFQSRKHLQARLTRQKTKHRRASASVAGIRGIFEFLGGIFHQLASGLPLLHFRLWPFLELSFEILCTDLLLATLLFRFPLTPLLIGPSPRAEGSIGSRSGLRGGRPLRNDPCVAAFKQPPARQERQVSQRQRWKVAVARPVSL
ncbi:hypothetical protein NQ318_020859 [Aromia moschata]|uniref:DUF4817 domain-containing protein n=1 Tax=Aromia moschata TaxID=1265417 RepID=A0AAV8XJ85_9CUCU|nr:hypothetical protein NQ318_020859 [Aromia moschata]